MIYLVEDDPSIRKLVSYALKGNGFEVRAFESGEERDSPGLRSSRRSAAIQRYASFP